MLLVLLFAVIGLTPGDGADTPRPHGSVAADVAPEDWHGNVRRSAWPED